MVVDFSSKLNFEAKQIKFVDKVYTLKTDHKTGLLLQDMQKKNGNEDGIEDKILKLVLGEKQYNELMEEIEVTGTKRGSVNYTENIETILCAVIATLYNQDYDEFRAKAEQQAKK